MPIMNDFQNKTIWIIGASSGIGEALARELARRGARLVLSARSKDKLETLNSALGGGHIVQSFDAGDANAMQQAFEDIKGQITSLDSVLFMAAIYTPHDGKSKSIGLIEDMLRVNLGGAFNTVTTVQEFMEQQGHGQIILCGSVAGYRGLPLGQPYCASKAAIISLAESLKIELAPKNIDVKVICPGFVKTPLTDKNKFAMPMIITAEEAASAIAKGMQGRAFEIHFPKKFTLMMKLLRVIPYALYFALMRQVSKKV